jgi:hypothetical protein
LKKRQEEVEELRRKQDEERKKREDFDRDGRQQVKFQNLSLVLNQNSLRVWTWFLQSRPQSATDLCTKNHQ